MKIIKYAPFTELMEEHEDYDYSFFSKENIPFVEKGDFYILKFATEHYISYLNKYKGRTEKHHSSKYFNILNNT